MIECFWWSLDLTIARGSEVAPCSDCTGGASHVPVWSFLRRRHFKPPSCNWQGRKRIESTALHTRRHSSTRLPASTAAASTALHTSGHNGLPTSPLHLAGPCEKGILDFHSPPRQSAVGQEQLRGPRRHRPRIPLRSTHTVQAVSLRPLRRAAHSLWKQRLGQGQEQEQTIMAPQHHEQEAVLKGAQQACADQGQLESVEDD